MININKFVFLALIPVLMVSSNKENNKPIKDDSSINLEYFRQNFEITGPYFQVNHLEAIQKINPAIFNACYGDYDTLLNKSTQYSTYLKIKYEENVLAIQNRINSLGVFPCPGPSLAQSCQTQIFSYPPSSLIQQLH